MLHFDPADLANLPAWVIELFLPAANVTDDDLRHLIGRPLERLDLAFNPVTDAGLAHLAGLDRLQNLNLTATRVGDAGLAHLGGLRQLRELDLERTAVTDAGLTHLKGLTALLWLDLTGSAVTDAAVAELQAALPKTKVVS